MLILFVFILYLLLRPFFIRIGLATTLELSVALIVILAFIFSVITLLITLLVTLFLFLFKRKESPISTWTMRLRKQGIMACSLLTALLVGTVSSQWLAYTPPILNEDGRAVEGSIASLEKVSINGSKQWISIRGHSKDNPVLLFLAGGPGGTQMAATREELKELEKHFVVVNWDQPGAGKSYHAVSYDELTPERYVEDANALTIKLKERFDQDKIYVMGESWGSALGIMLVREHPEHFHAFIGTGQMVAFEETEKIDYELAIEIAKERGDTKKLNELEAQGPPPYYGKDVVWKMSAYLMYLSDYMTQDPNISNGGYHTFRDLAGPEYGLYDKVNFLRGVTYTLNHVYQQLYDVDFRKQATDIEVPVYFLVGRHDINAPTALTEEYFELLNAPEKELIWFEHSGHSPWVNERNKFVKEVVDLINE